MTRSPGALDFRLVRRGRCSRRPGTKGSGLTRVLCVGLCILFVRVSVSVCVCIFQKVTHCFAVRAQLGVFESKKPVCLDCKLLLLYQISATTKELQGFTVLAGVVEKCFAWFWRLGFGALGF